MYYFEYPSYVAMLLRHIKYGIDVNMLSVTIAPFYSVSPDLGNEHVQYSYEYHFGNTDISINPAGSSYLSIPPFNVDNSQHEVEYTLTKMSPLTSYSVYYADACQSAYGENDVMGKDGESLRAMKVASDNDGLLQFTGLRNVFPCELRIDALVN